MSVIRVLLILQIAFIYVVSAATREIDSDFEAYIDFFENQDPLNACFFELGFCHSIWALQKIGLSAVIGYGLFYGALFVTLLVIYVRKSNKGIELLFSFAIVVVYLALINDYYMVFHLYRQNVSALLYSIFVLVNPILAFFVAALFHSSILSLLPIYILIRNFNFGEFRIRKYFFILVFLLYVVGQSLSGVLIAITNVDLNFIASRAEIYSNFKPAGNTNTASLFAYLFLVFCLVYKLNGRDLKTFDALFYLFISSILMACLTSFNEMLSYRYLVVSKLLSLPILLLAGPRFVSIFSNLLKMKIKF